MGLMDILNGMQNGPGGQKQPGKGGMSPITMALLGLLAVKAVQKMGGAGAGAGQPAAPGGPASAPAHGGGLGDILGGLFGGSSGGGVPAGGGAPAGGGSLGNLLQGGLGGLLGGAAGAGGGAAAGGALSDGLNQLIKGFQEKGFGNVAQSWVGNGPNQQMSSGDLAHALGGDTVDALARQTGMSREQLLDGLGQNLPQLVDQLTPNGRLPSAEEAQRMM